MSVITDRTQPFQDVDADIVLMIRNEYGEQPGLRLDRRQAARFWSIPQPVCDKALQVLTEAHYLELDATGRYRRA
jgi:hypothetical protein